MIEIFRVGEDFGFAFGAGGGLSGLGGFAAGGVGAGRTSGRGWFGGMGFLEEGFDVGVEVRVGEVGDCDDAKEYAKR